MESVVGDRIETALYHRPRRFLLELTPANGIADFRIVAVENFMTIISTALLTCAFAFCSFLRSSLIQFHNLIQNLFSDFEHLMQEGAVFRSGVEMDGDRQNCHLKRYKVKLSRD
ncbi:hypothetical protein L1887_18523 [Cichorium endivia]|nr:hypothetical protein L1887_18523 [Cichorium endivia]